VLYHIPTNVIPEKLQLQEFKLNQLEPGRHKLELIVNMESLIGFYGLRDIFIEFFEALSSNDVEKDENESYIPTGIESDLFSEDL